MMGEFLVVSGPRLGEGFSLSDDEVRIGAVAFHFLGLREEGLHAVVEVCVARMSSRTARDGIT